MKKKRRHHFGARRSPCDASVILFVKPAQAAVGLRVSGERNLSLVNCLR